MIESLDFMGVGAQKSGTTSLHYWLSQHPGIHLPENKEMHFFDSPVSGLPFSKHWYHRSMKLPARRRAVSGEITPSYMWYPGAMEKIRLYNASIKLIVLLRNPVDRAYSHWSMSVRNGLERTDFRAAILQEQERLSRATPRMLRAHSYFSRGLYSPQIRKILSLFPPDQLFVRKMEDMVDSPQRFVDDVFSFLGVGSAPVPDLAPRNAGNGAKTISPDDRDWLSRLYREDIAETSRLTGLDLSEWIE